MIDLRIYELEMLETLIIITYAQYVFFCVYIHLVMYRNQSSVHVIFFFFQKCSKEAGKKKETKIISANKMSANSFI